jgi:23S rRNA pseudouridine2605 synthase
VRLQKFMAQCGLASRRASERLIQEGKVQVNGAVAVVGQVIDPDKDEVTCNGVRVGASNVRYIILNKPPGVVTTLKDTHNRKTVLDCVKGVSERVFPVGRLDMDVEGALLLTNDGELAFRLTHPKYQVPKVYLAWVSGVMTPEDAMRLEQGVPLDDGMTAPAKVAILNSGDEVTQIRLTLCEGRKREIKRMCAHVGHPIRELRRIAVGNVKVRGLQPGQWRMLTDQEVTGLRKLVKLAR